MKGIFRNTIQVGAPRRATAATRTPMPDFLLMITRLMPQSGSWQNRWLTITQLRVSPSPSIDENGWNINTGGLYAGSDEGEDMPGLECQMELVKLFHRLEEISGFHISVLLIESAPIRRCYVFMHCA